MMSNWQPLVEVHTTTTNIFHKSLLAIIRKIYVDEGCVVLIELAPA